MNQPPKQQLQVQINDAEAEGIYSNLVIIHHNDSEFIMDFTRVMPNSPKARVQSRVILTPKNAKGLLRALKENVERYEKQFGKIRETPDAKNPIGIQPPPAPQAKKS